jgi:hypothetical protein
MAKVKEISVTVSKTFQFKQFEPSHVSITETLTLAPEDDKDEVKKKSYKRCSDTVNELLLKEGKRYQEKKGK